MKKQIIAIGGGAMSNLTDHCPIEKYILQQCEKENPNVCFLATATGDADRNITRFYDVFSSFKCKRAHLSLFSAPRDMEALLMKQDVIYVGGGNTRNLLALWREWNLDKILFSAGAICWYEEGLSDYIPSELNPIRALGYLKGSHCPHYDSETNRRNMYCELIGKGIISDGVAAEDDVALHYIDNELSRIISSNPRGKAFHVKKTPQGAQEIELKPDTFVE
jgi:dipeptidase E